jgi:hypothetical protein
MPATKSRAEYKVSQREEDMIAEWPAEESATELAEGKLYKKWPTEKGLLELL